MIVSILIFWANLKSVMRVQPSFVSKERFLEKIFQNLIQETKTSLAINISNYLNNSYRFINMTHNFYSTKYYVKQLLFTVMNNNSKIEIGCVNFFGEDLIILYNISNSTWYLASEIYVKNKDKNSTSFEIGSGYYDVRVFYGDEEHLLESYPETLSFLFDLRFISTDIEKIKKTMDILFIRI